MVIWGGFEGFGPCLGICHPTHPHLGEISQKNVFFTPSLTNLHWKRTPIQISLHFKTQRNYINKRKCTQLCILNEDSSSLIMKSMSVVQVISQFRKCCRSAKSFISSTRRTSNIAFNSTIIAFLCLKYKGTKLCNYGGPFKSNPLGFKRRK